jgi:peptidyl-prolyl cis-trans isomerase SurA
MKRIAFALLAACAPALASPTTIERIVAVVNTNIILLSEAKERAAQMGQPIDDKATEPAAKRQAEQALKQIVERMVEDDLVLQQATELKLAVEDAEVDRAIEEVRKQNNLDESTFKQALASQGYSLASYRKDLRRQLLRLKVVNTAVRSRISVTDEDIRAFYDQTSRQAGGHREAHVRHVLVAVAAGADAAEVDRKKAIAARVVELAHSGSDFAELARTYSDDPASKADGDLGTVKQGEGLPAVLEAAIFAMDPKDVRGPIRTDKGFEVIQLLEKKDGDVRPFSEVKDQIKQQLYAQQLEKQTQSWLSELKKKAHVDIRL